MSADQAAASEPVHLVCGHCDTVVRVPRDRFAVWLPAAFRVVFLAAFLTLAADFDADFLAVRPAGFLLLDFLAADLRPTG